MANFLEHNLSSGPARLNFLFLALLGTLPLGQVVLTNLFLLGMVVQALILYRAADWTSVFRSPIFWSSALFYLYFALSLAWSSNVDRGLSQLETKSSFLLAPLFILAGKRFWRAELREQAIKVFWWGNLAAIGLALGFALYRTLETGAFYETNDFGRRYYFLYTHLASPLMHPGYLGTYLGIALFGSYFLAARAEGKWRRIYILSALLFLVFMILLQARINLIALFLVAGGGLLIQAFNRRNYKLLSLPAAAALILALFVLFAPQGLKKRYLQWPDFSYDISGDDFNSATYRLAEWKCAWWVVENEPWLGTGLGASMDALMDSYRHFNFQEGIRKQFNAHNQYLETAVAGGLIGFLFLLSLLFTYLRIAFRQKDYFLGSSLLFFSICLITESMFERAWAILLFCLFFPMLLMLKESGSSAD